MTRKFYFESYDRLFNTFSILGEEDLKKYEILTGCEFEGVMICPFEKDGEMMLGVYKMDNLMKVFGVDLELGNAPKEAGSWVIEVPNTKCALSAIPDPDICTFHHKEYIRARIIVCGQIINGWERVR